MWTTRRGMNAMVGSRSLCLHRRSRTSSTNPRCSMQQIDRRAAVIAEKVRCSNEPVGSWNSVLLNSQKSRNGIAMNKNMKTIKTPPAITPVASGLLPWRACMITWKRRNTRVSSKKTIKDDEEKGLLSHVPAVSLCHVDSDEVSPDEHVPESGDRCLCHPVRQHGKDQGNTELDRTVQHDDDAGGRRLWNETACLCVCVLRRSRCCKESCSRLCVLAAVSHLMEGRETSVDACSHHEQSLVLRFVLYKTKQAVCFRLYLISALESKFCHMILPRTGVCSMIFLRVSCPHEHTMSHTFTHSVIGFRTTDWQELRRLDHYQQQKIEKYVNNLIHSFTDHLRIVQIQVAHDRHKLVQTFSQSRIVSLLFSNSRHRQSYWQG